jgi:hypothetical protein
MATSIFGPRKQRTRQHIIADLSVHHVVGFLLEEGHTAQRLDSDYGYDLVMWTFDAQGYAEPGSIYFQFKAMEKLRASRTTFVYDVDIRDYNLWVRENSPVVLILFDATHRLAFWLPIQQYFRTDATERPKKGAKTVRLRVPKHQIVNRGAIAKMRDLKRQVNSREAGEQS